MQTLTATASALALTMPRKALADALTQLSRVIEARNTIPILSNVLIRAGADGVELIGTDLDLMLTVQLPAEHVAPGAVTLEAKGLKAAVAKMRGDSVRIADVGGGKVTVTDCGTGAVVRVTSLPAADFPHIRAGDMPAAFTVPAEQMRADVERLRPCISTEETRYYLNGINLHFGTDDLRFAATDGHRLGRIVRPVPAELAGSIEDKAHPLYAGVIIPRKALAILSRLIGAKGAGALACEVSASKVRFRFGAFDLVSKLIDGSFPDYRRVIPSHNGKTLAINAAALSAAVQSASAHCDEKTRAVTLAMTPGWLTVGATNSEGEACALVVEGGSFVDAEALCGISRDAADRLAIGMNAKYAADLCAAFGDAPVVVAFADAAAPMLWTSPAAPEAMFVLMPMRTGEGWSPAQIAKLHRTPADALQEEGPNIVAAIDAARDRQSRTALRRALANLIAGYRDWLLSSGTAPGEARWLVRMMLASMRGDTGALQRLVAIRNHVPSGSFAAVAPARAHAVQPVPAVIVPAEPVEALEGPFPGAGEAVEAEPSNVVELRPAADAAPMPETLVKAIDFARTRLAAHPVRSPASLDQLWRMFVGVALDCGENQWVLSVGPQRDRKARNRGKVVISGQALDGLRDVFAELQPAAPVETPAAPEPVAPVPAEPVPAVETPAPVELPAEPAVDVAALVADMQRQLAALAAMIQPAAPVPQRASRDERLRVARLYLRMRAERAGRRKAEGEAAWMQQHAEGLRDQRNTVMREREAAFALVAKLKDRRTATASLLLRTRRTRADALRGKAFAEAAWTGVSAELDTAQADLARLQPLATALQALMPQTPAAAPRPQLVAANGRPLAA